MMESISDQICLDEPRKQNNISHCKANLTEKFDKIRQQLGEKRIFGNLIVCQFMLLSSWMDYDGWCKYYCKMLGKK